MPKKKKTDDNKHKVDASNVMGLHAAVVEQPITDTLEINYMPYAMSVIVSRAIPEIDGFKPSHRKLLYTMYKMELLTGARTKSANVVGQTMQPQPPRRRRHLRHHGAPLPGLRRPAARPLWTPRATSARSTPGTWPGPPPGTPRRKLDAHLRRAVPGHRQRHRGLCGQLRRHHEGAGPAAHHLPQHSGVRQQRHRRGHGLQALWAST